MQAHHDVDGPLGYADNLVSAQVLLWKPRAGAQSNLLPDHVGSSVHLPLLAITSVKIGTAL